MLQLSPGFKLHSLEADWTAHVGALVMRGTSLTLQWACAILPVSPNLNQELQTGAICRP